MNNCDKAKLKVLVKMILINEYPKKLSSKQLANRINEYNWAFKSPITSTKIGKLLRYELKRHENHFLSCIERMKKGGILVYYYTNSE